MAKIDTVGVIIMNARSNEFKDHPTNHRIPRCSNALYFKWDCEASLRLPTLSWCEELSGIEGRTIDGTLLLDDVQTHSLSANKESDVCDSRLERELLLLLVFASFHSNKEALSGLIPRANRVVYCNNCSEVSNLLTVPLLSRFGIITVVFVRRQQPSAKLFGSSYITVLNLHIPFSYFFYSNKRGKNDIKSWCILKK
jgi:hypothetical protein